MTIDGKNGFAYARAVIESIAEGLAPGDRLVREAVAHEFERHLRHLLMDPGYIWRHGALAKDSELEKAAERMLTATAPRREKATATALWKGGRLVIHQEAAYLVGGGFHMLVAMTSTRPEYYRRAGKNVDKWHIFITDFVSDALGSRGGSSPSSTNAGSTAGAYKSLRRIVETFFKVELTNVDDADGAGA